MTGTYSGKSDDATLTVLPIQPPPFGGHQRTISYLQVHLDRDTLDLEATPPENVTVSVGLTPRLQSRTIFVYVSSGSASGPWSLIGSCHTDSSGNCAVSWRPTEKGTYFFKAEFKGDMSYLPSSATSEPYSVTVAPEFVATMVPLVLALAALSVLLRRRSRTSSRSSRLAWHCSQSSL